MKNSLQRQSTDCIAFPIQNQRQTMDDLKSYEELVLHPIPGHSEPQSDVHKKSFLSQIETKALTYIQTIPSDIPWCILSGNQNLRALTPGTVPL